MRGNRLRGMVAAVCAAAVIGFGAGAQPPGGGFGAMANPAEMAKAWEAQAACVASSLSLNEDLSKKLADAYKTARESAMKSSMSSVLPGGPGGPGGPRGEAFRKAIAEERGKLETALKGFLDAGQTEQAMAALGTFDFRWDMMVNSLASLGLEDKAKAGAMQAIAAYVAEAGKARAAAGGDREAMRTKGAELREKLEVELGKLLSTEQIATLKEMPGFRRGGPGGEGRPRGPGAGPGAPGAPAAPGTPPAPPTVAPVAPPLDAKK